MTNKAPDTNELPLQADADTAVAKTKKPRSVAMPDDLLIRVRTKRGIGHIIRVREDRVRPFLIRLEVGETEFWAVISNVQPIGFAQAIAFRG